MPRHRSKKVSIIFISLYPILSEILYFMVQIGERVGDDNAVVSLLYLLIVFIIFGYAGRQEMQKKQIQTQQISMQQQNAYIESLEKLQSEMNNTYLFRFFPFNPQSEHFPNSSFI